MHHGIKGQKWGVRRFQNADGSLTAAGRERYGVGSKSGHDENGFIAALALTYGTVFATIAAMRVAEEIRTKKADKARDKAEERVKNAPKDKKTGLPLKEKNMTADQDMKEVNPSVKAGRADAENNCGWCTVAYDLRRRGYDVIAPLTTVLTDSLNFYGEFYKGAKTTIVNEKEFKDMAKKYSYVYDMATDRDFKKLQKNNAAAMKAELSKQPEGARGYFGAQWTFGGGHSMVYEIRNGKPVILDTQNNKKYTIDDIASKTRAMIYCRLDDKEPNYKKIKKEFNL